MNIFGGSIREFLGMGAIIALLSWAVLHEHGLVTAADARCDTRVAVQVGQQNTVTQADQHVADQRQIKQLQDQITKLQSDTDAAAGREFYLQTQLHDQNQVLYAYKKAHPHSCLDQRIPDALPDSLHTGADSPAKPPGQYR